MGLFNKTFMQQREEKQTGAQSESTKRHVRPLPQHDGRRPPESALWQERERGAKGRRAHLEGGGHGVGGEAELVFRVVVVGAAHGDGVVRQQLLHGEGRDLRVNPGQLLHLLGDGRILVG